MFVDLATLANAAAGAATTTTTTATTIDLSAADAFGGFVEMIVALLSFLSIGGLALSMTIGASKTPGTMAITAIAGLLSVLIVTGLFMTLSTHHTLKIDGCPAETWDRLGGTLAMVIGSIGVLTLVGILATSTIAAFTTNKAPVSSWPTELEGAFAPYDRRVQASQSRAWAFSVGAGVLTFLFAVGVYQGVTPDQKDLAKDMNMSNLSKKSKTSSDTKETPAPAKEAAPKAEEPKAEKSGEKSE